MSSFAVSHISSFSSAKRCLVWLSGVWHGSCRAKGASAPQGIWAPGLRSLPYHCVSCLVHQILVMTTFCLLWTSSSSCLFSHLLCPCQCLWRHLHHVAFGRHHSALYTVAQHTCSKVNIKVSAACLQQQPYRIYSVYSESWVGSWKAKHQQHHMKQQTSQVNPEHMHRTFTKLWHRHIC